MTVHTIMLPDRLYGRELRSIIWDDEAGTVTGDHSKVPYIQGRLSEPAPVMLRNTALLVILQDPAHDPQDFIWLLWRAWPEAMDDDQHTLPEPLRSVTPRAAEPNEPEVVRERLPDGSWGPWKTLTPEEMDAAGIMDY